LFGIDQAIKGSGGGIVVCLAKRLRFWTVAVRKNSIRVRKFETT
jgi:hypothetical protein